MSQKAKNKQFFGPAKSGLSFSISYVCMMYLWCFYYCINLPLWVYLC